MLQINLLGEAIRKARIDKHYTQEQLAEILDITPSHLKHIESGHRKPSVEVLLHIMEVLSFSLDNLVFPLSEHEALINEITVKLATCSTSQLSSINDVLSVLLKNKE